MERIEKNISSLRNQFWAGKRWVVVDSNKGLNWVGECYFDFQDAVDACQRIGCLETMPRIRVMGSVLKLLSGIGTAKANMVESKKLRDKLDCFPIRFFGSGIGWEQELLLGNFFPVIWKKIIHPLTEIRHYVILRKSGLKYKEIHRTANFVVGITYFLDFAKMQGKPEGCLLLVGQYFDEPLYTDPVGLFNSNRGLILYRAEWKEREMNIMQIWDPTEPVERQIPVFVRYYSKTGLLFFYDSMLKRIRPGDEPDFMDLKWFEFGE